MGNGCCTPNVNEVVAIIGNENLRDNTPVRGPTSRQQQLQQHQTDNTMLTTTSFSASSSSGGLFRSTARKDLDGSNPMLRSQTPPDHHQQHNLPTHTNITNRNNSNNVSVKRPIAVQLLSSFDDRRGGSAALIPSQTPTSIGSSSSLKGGLMLRTGGPINNDNDFYIPESDEEGEVGVNLGPKEDERNSQVSANLTLDPMRNSNIPIAAQNRFSVTSGGQNSTTNSPPLIPAQPKRERVVSVVWEDLVRQANKQRLSLPPNNSPHQTQKAQHIGKNANGDAPTTIDSSFGSSEGIGGGVWCASFGSDGDTSNSNTNKISSSSLNAKFKPPSHAVLSYDGASINEEIERVTGNSSSLLLLVEDAAEFATGGASLYSNTRRAMLPHKRDSKELGSNSSTPRIGLTTEEVLQRRRTGSATSAPSSFGMDGMVAFAGPPSAMPPPTSSSSSSSIQIIVNNIGGVVGANRSMPEIEALFVSNRSGSSELNNDEAGSEYDNPLGILAIEAVKKKATDNDQKDSHAEESTATSLNTPAASSSALHPRSRIPLAPPSHAKKVVANNNNNENVGLPLQNSNSIEQVAEEEDEEAIVQMTEGNSLMRKILMRGRGRSISPAESSASSASNTTNNYTPTSRSFSSSLASSSEIAMQSLRSPLRRGHHQHMQNINGRPRAAPNAFSQSALRHSSNYNNYTWVARDSKNNSPPPPVVSMQQRPQVAPFSHLVTDNEYNVPSHKAKPALLVGPNDVEQIGSGTGPNQPASQHLPSPVVVHSGGPKTENNDWDIEAPLSPTSPKYYGSTSSTNSQPSSGSTGSPTIIYSHKSASAPISTSSFLVAVNNNAVIATGSSSARVIHFVPPSSALAKSQNAGGGSIAISTTQARGSNNVSTSGNRGSKKISSVEPRAMHPALSYGTNNIGGAQQQSHPGRKISGQSASSLTPEALSSVATTTIINSTAAMYVQNNQGSFSHDGSIGVGNPGSSAYGGPGEIVGANGSANSIVSVTFGNFSSGTNRSAGGLSGLVLMDPRLPAPIAGGMGSITQVPQFDVFGGDIVGESSIKGGPPEISFFGGGNNGQNLSSRFDYQTATSSFPQNQGPIPHHPQRVRLSTSPQMGFDNLNRLRSNSNSASSNQPSSRSGSLIGLNASETDRNNVGGAGSQQMRLHPSTPNLTGGNTSLTSMPNTGSNMLPSGLLRSPRHSGGTVPYGVGGLGSPINTIQHRRPLSLGSGELLATATVLGASAALREGSLNHPLLATSPGNSISGQQFLSNNNDIVGPSPAMGLNVGGRALFGVMPSVVRQSPRHSSEALDGNTVVGESILFQREATNTTPSRQHILTTPTSPMASNSSNPMPLRSSLQQQRSSSGASNSQGILASVSGGSTPRIIMGSAPQNNNSSSGFMTRPRGESIHRQSPSSNTNSNSQSPVPIGFGSGNLVPNTPISPISTAAAKGIPSPLLSERERSHSNPPYGNNNSNSGSQQQPQRQQRSGSGGTASAGGGGTANASGAMGVTMSSLSTNAGLSTNTVSSSEAQIIGIGPSQPQSVVPSPTSSTYQSPSASTTQQGASNARTSDTPVVIVHNPNYTYKPQVNSNVKLDTSPNRPRPSAEDDTRPFLAIASPEKKAAGMLRRKSRDTQPRVTTANSGSSTKSSLQSSGSQPDNLRSGLGEEDELENSFTPKPMPEMLPIKEYHQQRWEQAQQQQQHATQKANPLTQHQLMMHAQQQQQQSDVPGITLGGVTHSDRGRQMSLLSDSAAPTKQSSSIFSSGSNGNHHTNHSNSNNSGGHFGGIPNPNTLATPNNTHYRRPSRGSIFTVTTAFSPTGTANGNGNGNGTLFDTNVNMGLPTILGGRTSLFQASTGQNSESNSSSTTTDHNSATSVPLRLVGARRDTARPNESMVTAINLARMSTAAGVGNNAKISTNAALSGSTNASDLIAQSILSPSTDHNGSIFAVLGSPMARRTTTTAITTVVDVPPTSSLHDPPASASASPMKVSSTNDGSIHSTSVNTAAPNHRSSLSHHEDSSGSNIGNGSRNSLLALGDEATVVDRRRNIKSRQGHPTLNQQQRSMNRNPVSNTTTDSASSGDTASSLNPATNVSNTTAEGSPLAITHFDYPLREKPNPPSHSSTDELATPPTFGDGSLNNHNGSNQNNSSLILGMHPIGSTTNNRRLSPNIAHSAKPPQTNHNAPMVASYLGSDSTSGGEKNSGISVRSVNSSTDAKVSSTTTNDSSGGGIVHHRTHVTNNNYERTSVASTAMPSVTNTELPRGSIVSIAAAGSSTTSGTMAGTADSETAAYSNHHNHSATASGSRSTTATVNVTSLSPFSTSAPHNNSIFSTNAPPLLLSPISTSVVGGRNGGIVGNSPTGSSDCHAGSSSTTTSPPAALYRTSTAEINSSNSQTDAPPKGHPLLPDDSTNYEPIPTLDQNNSVPMRTSPTEEPREISSSTVPGSSTTTTSNSANSVKRESSPSSADIPSASPVKNVIGAAATSNTTTTTLMLSLNNANSKRNSIELAAIGPKISGLEVDSLSVDRQPSSPATGTNSPAIGAGIQTSKPLKTSSSLESGIGSSESDPTGRRSRTFSSAHQHAVDVTTGSLLTPPHRKESLSVLVGAGGNLVNVLAYGSNHNMLHRNSVFGSANYPQPQITNTANPHDPLSIVTDSNINTIIIMSSQIDSSVVGGSGPPAGLIFNHNNAFVNALPRLDPDSEGSDRRLSVAPNSINSAQNSVNPNTDQAPPVHEELALPSPTLPHQHQYQTHHRNSLFSNEISMSANFAVHPYTATNPNPNELSHSNIGLPQPKLPIVAIVAITAGDESMMMGHGPCPGGAEESSATSGGGGAAKGGPLGLGGLGAPHPACFQPTASYSDNFTAPFGAGASTITPVHQVTHVTSVITQRALSGDSPDSPIGFLSGLNGNAANVSLQDDRSPEDVNNNTLTLGLHTTIFDRSKDPVASSSTTDAIQPLNVASVEPPKSSATSNQSGFSFKQRGYHPLAYGTVAGGAEVSMLSMLVPPSSHAYDAPSPHHKQNIVSILDNDSFMRQGGLQMNTNIAGGLQEIEHSKMTGGSGGTPQDHQTSISHEEDNHRLFSSGGAPSGMPLSNSSAQHSSILNNTGNHNGSTTSGASGASSAATAYSLNNINLGITPTYTSLGAPQNASVLALSLNKSGSIGGQAPLSTVGSGTNLTVNPLPLAPNPASYQAPAAAQRSSLASRGSLSFNALNTSIPLPPLSGFSSNRPSVSGNNAPSFLNNSTNYHQQPMFNALPPTSLQPTTPAVGLPPQLPPHMSYTQRRNNSNSGTAGTGSSFTSSSTVSGSRRSTGTATSGASIRISNSAMHLQVVNDVSSQAQAGNSSPSSTQGLYLSPAPEHVEHDGLLSGSARSNQTDPLSSTNNGNNNDFDEEGLATPSSNTGYNYSRSAEHSPATTTTTIIHHFHPNSKRAHQQPQPPANKDEVSEAGAASPANTEPLSLRAISFRTAETALSNGSSGPLGQVLYATAATSSSSPQTQSPSPHQPARFRQHNTNISIAVVGAGGNSSSSTLPVIPGVAPGALNGSVGLGHLVQQATAANNAVFTTPPNYQPSLQSQPVSAVPRSHQRNVSSTTSASSGVTPQLLSRSSGVGAAANSHNNNPNNNAFSPPQMFGSSSFEHSPALRDLSQPIHGQHPLQANHFHPLDDQFGSPFQQTQTNVLNRSPMLLRNNSSNSAQQGGATVVPTAPTYGSPIGRFSRSSAHSSGSASPSASVNQNQLNSATAALSPIQPQIYARPIQQQFQHQGPEGTVLFPAGSISDGSTSPLVNTRNGSALQVVSHPALSNNNSRNQLLPSTTNNNTTTSSVAGQSPIHYQTPTSSGASSGENHQSNTEELDLRPLKSPQQPQNESPLPTKAPSRPTGDHHSTRRPLSASLRASPTASTTNNSTQF